MVPTIGGSWVQCRAPAHTACSTVAVRTTSGLPQWKMELVVFSFTDSCEGDAYSKYECNMLQKVDFSFFKAHSMPEWSKTADSMQCNF